MRFDKLFCIGLNKTGTTSFKWACEQLGLRHLSFRQDLLIAFKGGRLDEVFAETDAHQSCDDWPYALMYRELLGRYGRPQALS